MMGVRAVNRCVRVIVSGVCFIGSAVASAGVPEPDNVFVGRVAIDTVPVTGSRRVSLEARVDGLSAPVGRFDFAGTTTGDCNGNFVPDNCELDCGIEGSPCNVAGCGTAVDNDGDGTPDECNFFVLRVRMEAPVPGMPRSDNAAIVGETVRIYAIDHEDRTCDGGDLAGAPCVDDDDCPNGTCRSREVLVASIILNDTGRVQQLDLLDIAACGIDPAALSSRIHVKETATGTADGSSWDNAMGDLTEALALKQCIGDLINEIWVAAGTHKPSAVGRTDPGDFRSATFSIPDGLIVVGGFVGNEDDVNLRDPQANITVLDGSQGSSQSITNNLYHVVTIVDGGPTTRLDGFVIRDANADETGDQARGGGMWIANASPVVANCAFIENRAREAGGGLYVQSGDPTIIGCDFTDNVVTDGDGAAAFVESPTAVFSGCTFTGNQAQGGTQRGGAIFLNATGGPLCTGGGNELCNADEDCTEGLCGGITLLSCWFTDNEAELGGAVYNLGSGPAVVGCVFHGNRATQGGALFNGADSNPRLVNTIFAGNRGTTAGGAVYNAADTVMALTNCALAANDSPSGAGGGIASEGSNNTLYVTNTILWANTASAGGNDQEKQITSAGVTVNIMYSTVQGWPGNLSGTANSGDNPQFTTDPTDGDDGWGEGGNDDFGDLHLMPGSPAIDAGTNTADVDPIFNDGIQPLPATDLDGNPRIADLTVDKGAYESPATGPDPNSLAWLLHCFSGPGVVPSPTPPTTPGECLAAFDEDGDQDVDLRDFSVCILNDPAIK